MPVNLSADNLTTQLHKLVGDGFGDVVGRLDARTSTKVKETSTAVGAWNQKVFAGQALKLKTEATRSAFVQALVKALEGKVIPSHVVTAELAATSPHFSGEGQESCIEFKGAKDVTLAQALAMLQNAVPKDERMLSPSLSEPEVDREQPAPPPTSSSLTREEIERSLKEYVPSKPLTSTTQFIERGETANFSAFMKEEISHQLGEAIGKNISDPSSSFYNHSDDMNSACRFKDMRPPVHSEVILNSGRSINANHVTINGQHQGIATQAPRVDTIDDLWAMVKEQDVGVILDLTNAVDKAKRKIPDYRPSGDPNWSPDGSLERQSNGNYRSKDGHVTVSPIIDSSYANLSTLEGAVGGAEAELGEPDYQNVDAIQKRNYLLSGKPGESRSVTSIHLLNWPDHGVLSLDALTSLVDEIKETQKNTPGKLLTHCSAGVGRTGTIYACLALNDMELTVENYATKVMQVIAEGRASRGKDFVQTAGQLELVMNYAEKRAL